MYDDAHRHKPSSDASPGYLLFSDPNANTIYRWSSDGQVSVYKTKGDEALDGIKVDQQGNLYVSGPGGLWILSSEGKHLGTLKGPEHPHNLAWGDDDGKTLYLAAQTSMYRLRLNSPGIRPPRQ